MQCKNKDGIKKLLPALFLFYWNIHCSLKSGSIKYKCRNRYKAWLSRNLLPDHSCHVFLADISKTAWHMKWGGKKTKEDIFPKLSRETRSADGSYEAHRPRPADGLQTLSWTRPTRTRKPSQFKRRAWKLGISAQRGPQNGVLTIKRNTGSGKKKKKQQQPILRQRWLNRPNLVLCAYWHKEPAFKVLPQSKIMSAEDSPLLIVTGSRRVIWCFDTTDTFCSRERDFYFLFSSFLSFYVSEIPVWFFK